MKTVDQIIAAAGGPEAVATACAVSRAALRKWRQFGVVPAKHERTLVRLSGGALSFSDFEAGGEGAAQSEAA